MKKYLAILLAVCLCITAFSSVMLVSAETTALTTYDIDLSQGTTGSHMYAGDTFAVSGNKLVATLTTNKTVAVSSGSQTWTSNYGVRYDGKDLDIPGNGKVLVKAVYKVTSVTDKVSIGVASWSSLSSSPLYIFSKNDHTTASDDKEYTLYGVFSNVKTAGQNMGKVKLAFGGKGVIEVSKIEVTVLNPANLSNYYVLTTIDGDNKNCEFVPAGSTIPAPAYRAGFEFAGWYNNPGFTGSPVAAVSADTTVYPKWDDATITTNVVTKTVDLTKSKRIGTDSDLANMFDSYKDNQMTIDAGNYDKRIFDGDTVKSSLWCKGAIWALKYADGSNVLLENGKQYVINVDYSIDRMDTTDPTFVPQLALVNNTANNDTTENGNQVLAARKHTSVGNYSFALAKTVGKGLPLRLIFAGDGVFTIKSITVASVESTPEKMDLSKSASIIAADKVQYASFSPATVSTPFTITTKPGTACAWFPFHTQWTTNIKTNTDNWFKNLFSLKKADGSFYKMYSGHQYRVQIEYAATAIASGVTDKDDGCRPSVAIVYNANSNTTSDNGSAILAADIYKESVGTHKIFTTKYFNAVNDRPLRLSVGGRECTIEIYSIKIIDIPTADFPVVTYTEDGISTAEFVNYGDNLKAPTPKEGCVFAGWIDGSGNKVETATADVAVTAQWNEGVPALENSARICDPSDPSKDKAKLTISYPSDVDGMKVAFEEYNRNYAIINDNGSLNTGTVWAKGGIVALKDALGNYIKFVSGKKYAINVTYDVTRLCTQDPYYAPQIGLCYNDNTGVGNYGVDNGQKMLAANKHLTCGSYTLSVIANGNDYSGKPLRLIFDGVGECVIKDVSIKTVDSAVSTHFAVKYFDKVSGTDVADILAAGTAVPVLNRTAALNFGGWFNGAEKVTTVAADGVLSAKWFDRKDINGDDETSILDLVQLNNAIKAGTKDLWFDVDRDESFGESDLVVIINERLERNKPTVNGNDMADYSIFVSNKSLMVKKAAEEIKNAVKSATNLVLPIVETETTKELAVVVDETMNADDYTVAFNGDKLVVAAGSDYAVSTAARKVADYIKLNGYIPASFALEGKYDANYSMVGNFKYAWGDEFDGSAIDTNKWTFSNDVKNGPYYASDSAYYTATSGNSTWTSNGSYKQDGTVTYVDNDYTVNNGVLTMNTRKTTEGYTGTKISAKDTFRYGIVEAKVKFAGNTGASNTFWARSKDTTPKEDCVVNEFDFVENFGTSDIRPNLHTWRQYTNHTNHGANLDTRKTVTDVTDGEYHYVAMEWTANFVRFYFDGELYLEQNISDQETWDAFRKSTYLIFCVDVPCGSYAIDSNGTTPAEQILANGGNIADLADFADSMSIDFVRVYQLGSSDYTLSK